METALEFVKKCRVGVRFQVLPPSLLGAAELMDNIALASYLGDRQFKYGGIAKVPGEHTGVRYC